MKVLLLVAVFSASLCFADQPKSQWDVAVGKYNSAGKAGGGTSYERIGSVSEVHTEGVRHTIDHDAQGKDISSGDEIDLSVGDQNTHYRISFHGFSNERSDYDSAASFQDAMNKLDGHYQVVLPPGKNTWTKASEVQVKDKDSGKIFGMDAFLERANELVYGHYDLYSLLNWPLDKLNKRGVYANPKSDDHTQSTKQAPPTGSTTVQSNATNSGHVGNE